MILHWMRYAGLAGVCGVTPETLDCSPGQMAGPSTPTGTLAEDHTQEVSRRGSWEFVWMRLV